MNDNKVHVKFFAIFKEYIGLKEDWAQIEPGMTVEQLWLRYTEHAKNPRVVNIRSAYSVNQRLAKGDMVLQGGEEIGFLPPVSGGAGKSTRQATRAPKATAPKSVSPTGRSVRRTSKAATKKSASSRTRPSRRAPQADAKNYFVTSRELRLAALVEQVEDPGAGAIVTFTGVVRNNAHDRAIKYLEYEAYDELAEKTLAQIGDEARTRWPGVRLAMAHRTGHLDIGVASVLIAASAPHRAEAFAACRYAIERIKAALPVWKKEFATDDEYWVEGPVAGEMTPEQAEQVVRQAEQG